MVNDYGKEIKKLGFGMMRLPHKGLLTDVEQTKRMVDLFMEAGCTYFDTAFVYPGSEEATRKALVDRYPREAYTLATKINAAVVPTEKAAKAEFETSLKRTNAGYFDYYLLHSLMDSNYRKYEKFHLWDFVEEQKRKGLIRHYGFSFHSGPKLLDRILTDHPEAEFVQLQINYADWENPSVTSRTNYEVARKHGKPIVVMEPVKGGNLANPPKEVLELFRRANPSASPASWAIRFAASLDGILTILSGMSNLEQMRDNLSFMREFVPLSDEEQKVIHEAQRLMGRSNTIPCTTCHYCTKGCPKQIPIPEIFTAMNQRLGSGQLAESVERYRAAVQNGSPASACISCRQCEKVCPQHILIVTKLKECAAALEG